MNPGITLALIVKDDAERLRRCIDSVRAHVDEIVVVDTGSSDASPEVARQFGARVLEIAWPGAFDEALNTALAEVKTDWTLRLDSDEWLGPGEAEKLALLAADDRAQGYTIIRRNLGPSGPTSEIALLRLIRTHRTMRFRGMVHENIPPEAMEAAAEGRSILHSNLLVLHDGYAEDGGAAKRARNLPLLQRELAQNPDSLYHRLALAELLVAENNPEGAAIASCVANETAARRHTPPELPAMAWAFAVALEAIPEDELYSQETENLVRYALQWMWASPLALWAVATLEVRRGQLHQAYHALLELEEMALTGLFDRGAPVPLALLGDPVWQTLGVVAHQLGKQPVARRNYARLLENNPDHPVAKQNMRLLS